MNKEHLTESMKKKTDKIIETNELLKTAKKSMKFYYSFVIASVLYFLFIDKELWNNMASFFDVSNPTYYQFGLIDILLFLFLIIILIILYFKSVRINKLQKEFDKLRVDIINQMEQKFCLHSESCYCEDRYITEMDNEYNIDVVFK